MPPEPPVTIATRCWGEVMAFSFSNFGDVSAPAGRGGPVRLPMLRTPVASTLPLFAEQVLSGSWTIVA
jgi:hypothetical protein